MNPENEKYFTFSFNVNPDLNDGFTEVFKQGSEDWWWYSNGANETTGLHEPMAGPVPNFTGATFKSLHQYNKKVL